MTINEIPNPNWNYPPLYSDLSLTDKKAKAEELFAEYYEESPRNYLDNAERLANICQHDFKLCSLLAYRYVTTVFSDPNAQAFDFRLFDINGLASFLPVRYCGGNMCFGRVFSINHCAFSSPDSIIGFRNAENTRPQEYFKIAKGLKYIGCHKNWTLFKLDRDSTDDLTGVLYSPLEKNFEIEFAHFPHDSERRILFRWEDC